MKIISAIKYWAQIFLIPLYWFSFITPRNKSIWLLGCSFGKRFSDNPKYLYLYLNQFKKPDIRPIWISRSKKVIALLRENQYEAYYNHSIKGIWYCLRGGVYIFDNYSKDISFWLSGGARKVNLWHGVGNKRINYDNRFDEVRHPKNRWDRFKTFLRRMSDEKPNHYILATSKVMATIFASAFRTTINQIIIEGYPRNDFLISNAITNLHTRTEKELISELTKYKEDSKKILIYMPTFRDSETKFFDVVNLEKLNTFLAEKGYVLYIKLHPKSKLLERFQKINCSNIINVKADVDAYSIIKYVDLLITDYSSIYSDYLLLNRPSVLFPYDYEEYNRNTRDCYFEYEDYMRDMKAYTMEELEEAIEKAIHNDTRKEERKQVIDWMFEKTDGKACERLTNIIQNEILG